MLSFPVSNVDRVTEQTGDAWKFENRTPAPASQFLFGVSISEPNAPKSPKAVSSPTHKRMFGWGPPRAPPFPRETVPPTGNRHWRYHCLPQ